MRNAGVDEFLISEIKEGGLGSELYKEASESRGWVLVKNLISWLNVEMYGQKIIKSLVENFEQVEMLEHYNDYYKLRVPRQDKTIGYVFALIENNKEDYAISEYSVSQTTLE
jgi:ATP-binding cassette subfamily A (ABC1) protein 3